jgi:imidazolonepropionase-like amidohydrolase
MKTRTIILLSLFTLLGLLVSPTIINANATASLSEQQQPNTTTAFVNVNVIPMDTEQVLENQTVLVENDRITAIGPAAEIAVPDDAEVIEGNGAYLMPGLADMHVHLDFDPDPASLQLYLANGVTTLRSLNTLPEHLEWRDQVNNGDLLGPTIYSSGRTIVGVPGEYSKMVLISRLIVIVAPLIIGLVIWLLLWLLARFTPIFADFGQIKRFIFPSLGGLLLVGILLYFTIPLTTFMQILAGPTILVPESEDEARQMVREQYEAGVDFIKPYNYLPREHYFAVMDEAEKLGLYTAGHTTAYPEVVSVQETIAAGQDEVVHADEFTHYFWVGYDPNANEWVEYDIDMSLIEEVAALVAEADMTVTPTLVTNDMSLLGLEDLDGLLSQPQYEIIRPETMETWLAGGRFTNWQGQQTYRRDKWRVLLVELTKAFNDHGVLLNVGTDVSVEGVVPGFAVHQELLRLVEAGLTNYEALAAGTRNPGITVDRMVGDANFGTIVSGNRADLILLPNNPLEDVAHTQERLGVMVRGQWFTQAELDTLVDELVASYRES